MDSRCLIALRKIRSGENRYYTDRLNDSEFIKWIDYLIEIETEKESIGTV